MNIGRYVGAVVAVWLVRFACNWLFYGMVMRGYFESIAERFPGAFREVVPGFIATDLLFALIFVYLWTKAGACFGGGIQGGLVGGAWIGILFGVVWNLYYFFSVTYMTPTDLAIDAVYQIVTVAIQGAVAAAIYKVPVATPARAV